MTIVLRGVLISALTYSVSYAQEFVCGFNPFTRGDGLLGRLFDDKPPCPQQFWGNYFRRDAREYLSDLIRETGTRRDRYKAAAAPSDIPENVWRNNAVAFLCREGPEVKMAVVWDPSFMQLLDQRAGTYWASVAVLAHEIAHHANGDTSQDRLVGEARKNQELHADWWSGRQLALMGVSKREAVAVFNLMGRGNSTHPPSAERVQWAAAGWDDAGTDADDPCAEQLTGLSLPTRYPPPPTPAGRLGGPYSPQNPCNQARTLAFCADRRVGRIRCQLPDPQGYGSYGQPRLQAQGAPCYCRDAFGGVFAGVVVHRRQPEVRYPQYPQLPWSDPLR